MEKIGRNDLCPCGSGKKYKKCCGSSDKVLPVREKGPEQVIYLEITQKFKNYIESLPKKKLDKALQVYLGACKLENIPPEFNEIFEINLREWLFFDWIPDQRNRETLPMSAELGKIWGDPTKDQKQVLDKLIRSYIGVYEVIEVIPGKGVMLEDLLFGGKNLVIDYSVSEMASVRDIIATRLIQADGKYILSGCAYSFTPINRKWIVDDVKQNYEIIKKDWEDSGFKHYNLKLYLREQGHFIAQAWLLTLEIVKNGPKLANFDGEEVVFIKSYFDVLDEHKLIEVLKTLGDSSDLQKDQEKKSFTIKKDTPKGKNMIAGTMVIENGKMILETNSNERAKYCKEILMKTAGDAIKFKMDSIQDIKSAIKESSKKSSVKDEIPEEIKREVYQKYMDQYYGDTWLKSPVPAIGNISPEEALKTEKGKKELERLLDIYEDGELKKKANGEPWYDINKLRRSLDIKNK